MARERESVEISAKTVDEAVERGLSQLGLARDQVEVQVIHPGRSGVLGIGAEDARVRITALPVESPSEMEPSEEDGDGIDVPFSAAAAGDLDVAELATEILQGLLDGMQVHARVEARLGEDLVEEEEGCIEGGTVRVRATRSGPTLAVRVSDTGPGFSGDRDDILRRGSGLSNLLKRLEILYPGEFRMALLREDGGGALVAVEIPFRVKPRGPR